MSDNDDYFCDDLPDDYSEEAQNHVETRGTATWGYADTGQGSGVDNGATIATGIRTGEGGEGKVKEQRL